MLHLTFFIHGNLQYGEFPESEAPEILHRSYLPTLRYFAGHPELRAVFEFSGYSFELMAEGWPETIELLRRMLKRGQIELMGSTLASPILPLIPTGHARRQIVAFHEICEQLFGELARLRGLYLQEYAYDPSLAPLLASLGYTYTILTPELLLAGMRRQLNTALVPLSPRSPGTKDMALLDLLHPVIALGANGSRLAVIPFHRDLIDHIFDYSNGLVLFDQIADLLAALDGAYCQSTPGLLIFGPSDAEFVGYYGYLNRTPIVIEKLGELMQRVAELPFVQVSLPHQYLAAHPPNREVYVPAGSSEPSFDIWSEDPDNRRLNDLCAEAASKLQLAESLLRVQPGGDHDQLEQAWRAMLLSENSDGRGWMPHPERRLFCYDQALLAIRLAEEILDQA